MNENKQLICEKTCELLRLTKFGTDIDLKINFDPETEKGAIVFKYEKNGESVTDYFDASNMDGESLFRYIYYSLFGVG